MAIALLFACFPGSGQSAPAASKTKVTNSHGKVIVIGASYAKGWDVAELGGRPVINKGVGGQETHEVLARFDQDVVASAPRAVVIWGFINDIHRSTPQEVEAKLLRSRDNINGMIEKARRRGIVPILATEVTLPVGDSWRDRIAGWINALRGKQGYQDYVNGHVLEMNRWIRSLAAEKNITLLDFEQVLADSDGKRRKPEYATPDGTHLSARAYEALTEYVRRLNLRI